jgi:hypothetical protein
MRLLGGDPSHQRSRFLPHQETKNSGLDKEIGTAKKLFETAKSTSLGGTQAKPAKFVVFFVKDKGAPLLVAAN